MYVIQKLTESLTPLLPPSRSTTIDSSSIKLTYDKQMPNDLQKQINFTEGGMLIPSFCEMIANNSANEMQECLSKPVLQRVKYSISIFPITN